MINYIVGIGLCLAFMLAFYLPIAYSVKRLSIFYNPGKGLLASSALITFLSLLFCYYIVNGQHFIYCWDFGGYWTNSVKQMQTVIPHPYGGMYDLYHSIYESDYNLIITMLIAIPLFIFGISFKTYVMINFVLFVIPFIYIASFATIKLIARKDAGFFISVFLLYAFSPLLLYPVVVGYLDVAVLLPCFVCLLLLINLKVENKSVIDDLLMGCLLLEMLMLRRYFAYFALVFVLCLILKCLNKYKLLIKDKKLLINALSHFLIIGFSSLGLLFIFFRDFIINMIVSDYGKMYEGQASSDKNTLILLATVTVMAVLLLIPVFINKKNRKFASLMAFMTLMIIAVFYHTQDMGAQHRFLYLGSFYILLCIWMDALLCLLKKKAGKVVMAAFIAFNCYFTSSYFEVVYNVFTHISILEPVYEQFNLLNYTPLVRNDIDTLHDLKDYLNDRTLGTDKHVYVTASSFLFNSDVLRAMDKPESTDAVNNLYVTCDYDMRDGFPREFINIDYVVTASPDQLHLQEGTQEVVRVLNEMVMDETSAIGSHYKCLSSFELDDGITAYVYEKISNLTDSDYKDLRNYFEEYYPDYPELFTDRIHVQ